MHTSLFYKACRGEYNSPRLTTVNIKFDNIICASNGGTTDSVTPNDPYGLDDNE